MSKPVIGIDGNEANVTNRVGSNVFAFELLQAMDRYLQDKPLFEAVVYLSQPPLADMPPARSGWRYEIVPHQPLWGLWRLPLGLWQKRQIDLFFSPGHYLPSFSPVPLVSTIMDLAYEHFPTYFRSKDRYQLSLFTRWGVKHSIHTFAISEATKQDIIALYHQPAEKISVVYPGVEERQLLTDAVVQDQLKHLDVQAPYILFVGTLQPRKNLVRLVKAFEWLREQGFPGQLVIAGKIGWQAEAIVDSLEQSSAHDHIRHLGFVSDEAKQALIQSAEMLVLPGLYEGFGIPPLEAIQLGTVPVVSDVSSLPEVVPVKELRFDPESVADMGQTMLRVWQQSALGRKAWIQELQQQTKKFNWDTSAELVCHQLFQLVEK